MSAPLKLAACAAARTRVLVVDDSATARGLIRALLARDPTLEIVAEAADPHEARAAIKATDPDVVTLDVEMPKMNGLDFLDRLMRLRPTPVIMVSSLTAQGADAAIRALEMGAFDCVGKLENGDHAQFAQTLIAKIKAAAASRGRIRALSPWREHGPAPPPSYRSDGRLVAIGASTGGVEALIAVLSQFPAQCPPTVVTQHMPPAFTRSFAARLDRLCAPSVMEASDEAPLRPGHVYLAPGGVAHLVVEAGAPTRCRLARTAPVNGHRPSVDVMFRSIAKAAGGRAVGVILTGMGRDGAEGLLAMREAGALTLGQSESSCLIYGMPKAAFEIGATQRQVSLDRIGSEILRVTCVA